MRNKKRCGRQVRREGGREGGREGTYLPSHSLNSGVSSSLKRGTRMSTLLPRRVRMFFTKVPKRGWGLMQLSGT